MKTYDPKLPSARPVAPGLSKVVRPAILILLACLCGFMADGCGKWEKWRSEVQAFKKQRLEGQAQRRRYLETHLATETKATIPADFYTYDGFRDWWRMPLVFPYQIACIDTQERGILQKYNPRHPVADPNQSATDVMPLSKISRLATDNRRLLAEMEKEGKTSFVLLEYANGQISEFATEAALWEAADRSSFAGPRTLAPVASAFASYYDYQHPFPQNDGKKDQQP